MKEFMDEDFLLEGDTARHLYHAYAKAMPIADYHCHLSPKEIYENQTWNNLSEVWLGGDHYKWRAMRAYGIEEAFITGDGDAYGKFLAFAETLSAAIGNPLYHWSHMELRRYFGITEVLNKRNAPVIWEKANAILRQGGFGARDLIVKSRVTVVCTTDDPADSLEYHLLLKQDSSFPVQVLPSFRPDQALAPNRDSFAGYIARLGQSCGRDIRDYGTLLAALEDRVRFFSQAGCRVCDHGLDEVVYAEASAEEVSAIFAKALQGSRVSAEEERQYKTHLLIELGKMYKAADWVVQYHMNASRNNNGVMFERIGPDTGYDAMGDSPVVKPLSRLLDALERQGGLSRTIVYSLNPNDTPALAALIGAFQGGGIPGRMQLGAAWWFNDTKEGMLQQMKTLAESGIFGRFVGMLTDSRSFLSYTRHEYFRRILCSLIGSWVDNGEFPDEEERLGALVQDICYNNAMNYFGFSPNEA